jgi:SAM-dependent methyltransferase
MAADPKADAEILMDPVLQEREFLNDVRHYYDKNTPRFSSTHESAIAKAMHRELWGPCVETEKEAFEYVNALVLRAIGEVCDRFPTPMRVLDLGCGIGGTLLYLAARMVLDGIGVTLSRVGVRIAEGLAREAGLAAQCRFVEANYLDLPEMGERHMAYAIESFLHGPDPGRFFQSASAVMPVGARLIICDDFVTERAQRSRDRKARRNLTDFQRRWHVGSLITTSQAEGHAVNAGLKLVEDQDLTPYLRLRRPCDRTIAAFVNIGRGLPIRSPWWDSWVGGHAIQRCLLTGLVRYHFLVFDKAADLRTCGHVDAKYNSTGHR